MEQIITGDVIAKVCAAMEPKEDYMIRVPALKLIGTVLSATNNELIQMALFHNATDLVANFLIEETDSELQRQALFALQGITAASQPEIQSFIESQKGLEALIQIFMPGRANV